MVCKNEKMKTLFIGQSLLKLRTVDSTNKYAQELLKTSPVHEGTIVSSDVQTNGRGQRGNEWKSESYKNLTISIVLYPSFLSADEHFYLNKAVTVGIQRFLKDKVFDDVKIKWPNDVYVNDLKIGGVLIENTLKGRRIGSSVVGIGLNVNQEIFHGSLLNPTSMKLETGQFFNLDFCLEELAGCIETAYLKIRNNTKALDEEYLNTLYKLNEYENYLVENEKLQLKITGVDSYGKLITKDQNGQSRSFDFKEIQFIH